MLFLALRNIHSDFLRIIKYFSMWKLYTVPTQTNDTTIYVLDPLNGNACGCKQGHDGEAAFLVIEARGYKNLAYSHIWNLPG